MTMNLNLLLGILLFTWCIWSCYRKSGLIDERVGTVFTFVISYMYAFYFSFHFSYLFSVQWLNFVLITLIAGGITGALFRMHTIVLGISIATMGAVGGMMLQVKLKNLEICGIQMLFSSSQIFIFSTTLTLFLMICTLLLRFSFKKI